jgi:copper chaperone CopZ
MMSYTHHIPGRIRVRSAVVKRDASRAAALQRWLEAVEGVQRVEISLVTGSVLIRYQTSVTDGEALIAELREREWITKPIAHGTSMTRAASLNFAADGCLLQRRLASAILRAAAEILLERSIMALIAAAL